MMIARSGIRINGMASSLCVQRIAMVNSLPTPLFQAVIITNSPVIASRMQEIATTPCVIRAKTEWRWMYLVIMVVLFTLHFLCVLAQQLLSWLRGDILHRVYAEQESNVPWPLQSSSYDDGSPKRQRRTRPGRQR